MSSNAARRGASELNGCSEGAHRKQRDKLAAGWPHCQIFNEYSQISNEYHSMPVEADNDGSAELTEQEETHFILPLFFQKLLLV